MQVWYEIDSRGYTIIKASQGSAVGEQRARFYAPNGEIFDLYFAWPNGSTVSFAIEDSDRRSMFINSYPGSTTGSVNIALETRYQILGNYTSWAQQEKYTLYYPINKNEVTTPKVTSFSVSPTATNNGYNMVGVTALQASIGGTAQCGASVKSYNFTVEGKTYTTAPYTSAALTQGGWQTVTGTVEDSRGFTASVSKKIWVMANMPTLDVTGGYLNEAINCNITPANKDAYSRLVLYRKVGSSYEDIKTVDVGTKAVNSTQVVTLTSGELAGTYEKYPDTINVPIRVKLLTYNDAYTTQIEENTKEITLKIPDNADTKPSITNIATLAVPTLLNQSELYIKGKNGVKPTVTAVGKYKANIAKITWTVNEKAYNHGETSDAITSFGTLPIVVTATDTRGITNSATKTISVNDYTKPLLSAVDGRNKIIIERRTEGNVDFLYIAAKRNYTKLNGNKCSMSFRVKPYKGEWGSNNTIISEGTTSDAYDQSTGYELNKELTYTIEITLVDSLNEKDVFVGGVATEAVFMDRAGSRGSIAFGGHVTEDNAFEVYQDAYFRGALVIDDVDSGKRYRITVSEDGTLKATLDNSTFNLRR